MKKNLILILIAAALIVAGFWYWNSVKEEVAPVADDSSASINEDMENVELGDLESEFTEIDAELSTL